MKKVVLISFVTMLLTTNFYGQETDSKLKFHAIEFSPLTIYGADNTGGIAFSIGLAVKKKKNIYKLYGMVGSEINIASFGASTSESFSEVSVFFGREKALKKWLYIEGYVGLGYFRYTITTPVAIPGTGGGGWFSSPDYDYENAHTSTIGFPLQGRIGFQTGTRFSLGLQFHININSINTSHSLGLFLQWRLGKVQD